VPTREWTARFEREYRALTAAQQTAFRSAVRKFIADLRTGRFRKSLRIKAFRGSQSTFEMTWARDGRALFQYGEPIIPGEPHVIWLRVGGHEIFDTP
jgi:hypothetical protein